MQPGNLALLSPVIYLIGAAIVVLMLGVVAAKRPDKGLDHYFPTQYAAPAFVFGGLVLVGELIYKFIAALAANDFHIESTRLIIIGGHAQLTVDPFAAIFTFIAFAGTLIVMLLSLDHFGEYQKHKAEYYSLLMFACAAASIAAAASDLIAIYLAIEFLSLVSYVLAAFAKTDRRSGEAGLKYFLYGAACSAFMLYGMSILFGITGGNTSLSAIAAGFRDPGASLGGAGFVGVMFVLVGLGFKLALVPFHFWAPDTYEGAPTPITAFLSVVSKAAGLAVIIRFLMVAVMPIAPVDTMNGISRVIDVVPSLSWYWVLVVLAAVSMFYGNLVAIPQRNIKRMLAYSSIAQVGYMMVGILADMHVFQASANAPSAVRNYAAAPNDTPWGLQGVLIYILAYLFMNLGAFAVVVAVGKRLKSDAIESYAGLMKMSPFYAAALTIFLLSLAGIPPTAGFLGKFFVFGSAVKVGLTGHPELIALAVLGVINSVIAVYYYFNVVRLMFFGPSEEIKGGIRGSLAVNTAIVITLVLTLAVVVFAKPVSSLASSAVYASTSTQILSR